MKSRKVKGVLVAFVAAIVMALGGGGAAYSAGSALTMGTADVALYAKWNFPSAAWYRTGTGSWTDVTEGIKVNGTSDRSTSVIYPLDSFSTDGVDIYIKWEAHGNNNYACFADAILNTAKTVALATTGHSFSTNNSYSGSYLVTDDTWYYTHYRTNSDRTYSCITSTGNYDDNDEPTAFSNNAAITEENWSAYSDDVIARCDIRDNHGGTQARFLSSVSL